MIAAELRGGSKPSLNEALGWIGSRVDDINGVAIGRLEDVWIDPATGEPRWLLVKEGRFGGRSTLVPFDDAVPGDGHVWIPYERDVVREAPQVEPAVPLTQQVEMTLRNHYAANTTAAVSQGPQQPDPAAAGEPEPEQGTVRLASAQPAAAPGEVPPPRMPERPAPPVNAPPPLSGRQERQGAFPGQAESPQQPFQQQPPPQEQPPPQQPPPPQRPPAPQRTPAPQQPPAAQQQEAPQPQAPPPSPPQQQPPPPQWVQAPSPVWGEPPQPASPPPPAPPPPPAYQPPPVPQPAAADPLSALAGLSPGQMVEIELSGELTIRGELRRIRIVPPEQPGYRD